MILYVGGNLKVLNKKQVLAKRAFDVLFSFLGLLSSWWVILLAWVVASLDTKSNGFFIQQRVGLDGRLFRVVKIKTMKPSNVIITTVTKRGDSRITKCGAFFRRTKIDELPQLWNVLIGDMSFVGPRPDVPGFADQLKGHERLILSIRPGITGPATIKYKNEEEILFGKEDPEQYNRDVIFPDKVTINIAYIQGWSLYKDVGYIIKTIFG